MIGCPVIHVSGDHPEQVARAAKLAADYRQVFRKYVVLLLDCASVHALCLLAAWFSSEKWRNFWGGKLS